MSRQGTKPPESVIGADYRSQPPGGAPPTRAALIAAQAERVASGESGLIDASGWSDEQVSAFVQSRRR